MKNKPIPIPIVTAGAKVQVIDEESMRWKTIAEIPYTPRHINETLKAISLTWAWVYFMGGREIWRATNGNLAEKDK